MTPASLLWWDGAKWTGYDVPDIAPTAKPQDVGPFIMNPEGVSRLFARGMMRDGPFPVHYEPFREPGGQRGRPQGAGQSGGPRVQGRLRPVRRARVEGVPLMRRPPIVSRSTSTTGPRTTM